MIRAFVALPLPETVRSQLAVTQFLLPLPRRVAPQAMHVTLAFLGEQTEPVLEEVHHALAAIRVAAFSIRLSGLGVFGGDRPRSLHARVAPEPALERLERKVVQAVRGAGVALDARRFVPHVTLGRWPQGGDVPRLERALADQAGFATEAFAVRDFILYESLRRPDGPHYEELARYPLAA